MGHRHVVPDLADDIAIEARLALTLTEEIKELDERIEVIVRERDPHGIIHLRTRSRRRHRRGDLGTTRRRQPLLLPGRRPLVQRPGPILSSSGVYGRYGSPTKPGLALLRDALFISANQARRLDPTLAAKYHRLMVDNGKHHNSALCHIATTLLTRVVACWKNQTLYHLHDVDGRPVQRVEVRAIIANWYPISVHIRRTRTTTTGTGRRSKESQRAPPTGPSNTHAKPAGAA